MNNAQRRIAQLNGILLKESEATEADARKAGLDLSTHMKWDGYLIMVAAGEALEDANFHKEAAIIRKMAEDL